MATIYAALRSQVTVVEWMNQISPGADTDLVAPLQKRMASRGIRFLLQTKLTRVDPLPEALVVHFEGPAAPQDEAFDAVLVAVGRRANGGCCKQNGRP